VIGEKFEPLLIESRRMGCVSFAKNYFHNETITPEFFNRAYLAACLKLESTAILFKKYTWDVAMGASGTIKAAHGVLVELGYKDGMITRERLTEIKNMALKYKTFSSLDIPGLSNERKQVFVPGLAILLAVFDSLEIKELRLSDGALREGVLYEMESRFRHQDIRQRTALSLAEHYNIDREQAKRVLKTMEE
ncbi:exopolyphosphatase, partial [Vibrio parahaemolyticus]|nr:exopolyphosphatase [Vibrio parahaemolyticus]